LDLNNLKLHLRFLADRTATVGG